MKRRDYGVVENLKFVHEYIMRSEKKKYFAMAISSICLSIITTFMLAYLPPYIIGLLSIELPAIQLFMRISIYSLVLYTGTIICSRIENDILELTAINRLIAFRDFYDRTMDINYEHMDIAENRVIIDSAHETYMDAFHEGFGDFVLDFKNFVKGLLGVIVYSLFVGKISFWILITLLVCSSFSLMINNRNKIWIEKKQSNWRKINTKKRYINDSIASLNFGKDIRIYSMSDWLLSTYDDLVNMRLNWYDRELRREYLFKMADRLSTLIKYGIIYYIAYRQVVDGMSAEAFTLLIALILGTNTWIKETFDNLKYLQLNNVVINNARVVLDLTDEVRESGVSIPESNTYEIVLKDVSYRYPGTDVNIIDNINMRIKAGEKIALVGLNGAGKTTLVKLICGLYEPTEGKILLNGKDISKYSKDDYYKLFSIVFQDIHQLSLSIAQNVSCETEAETDYDRVEESLKLAGLHGKVHSLVQGVNTMMTKELDENGVVFSGGEAQKLMLARTIYDDSPIVILDEPTSALDALMESEIYENYNTIFADKTSVFISHRLSSTKFCDRIIFLENGLIVEEGTHDELLKMGERYASMYEIQASYYNGEVEHE